MMINTLSRMNTWSSIHKAVLTIAVSALCLLAGCSEIEEATKKAIAATQPPVQVSLTPYLIFDGYYVNVLNTSDTQSIGRVTLTYTSASGNSVSQDLGTLSPGQSKTLDPSNVNWRVVKHETISVSASSHIPKTLKTNVLIYD